MSNTFSYAYASFTVPLYGRVFYTDVKVINPKSNKSITIKMLVDTGALNSQIDGTKYGTALGIDDITTGEPATSIGTAGSMKSYKHMFTIEFGKLKPIMNVPIFLTASKPQFNNLGWTGALEKLQVEVTPVKLTYTELAQAAMANAQAYFRSRV